MKKIILSIVFLAGVLIFQSCSDEKIKPAPPDFGSANQASTNINAPNFINNLYQFVPRGFNRLDSDPTIDDNPSGVSPAAPNFTDPKTAMVASATDEAVHATRNSAAELWGTGQWNAGPQNNWDTQIKNEYAGIRRTFEFSDDIYPRIHVGTGGGEIASATRDRYLGEALFIRALLNFELLKRYGGYPIVKSELNATNAVNIPKNSYTDCVSYISALCDQAANLLPLNYSASITADFGRATKGAALAVKARMLLYAASPLNNTTNDITKWKAAADAASAVIKLNTYSLMPGAAGAGYTAAFSTFSGSNTELIFGRLEAKTSDLERMNGLPSIPGGLGGTCPSLNLVNDYETVDGKPFDWNNATMAANPFAGRDPRFAASILFNGATWMSAAIPGGITTPIIQSYVGGKDGDGVTYATRTGFYLRKFMVISATFGTNPAGTANHLFPNFRYAEVLLNFAEAANEAYGPDDPSTYGMTARAAIILIRTRAGLTGNLNVASATSKDLFRTAIQHERRIELAFEEHRGFDLRRWKLAETVLNQPVMGLRIVKNGSAYTYSFQNVENRVFVSPKMYFYPFPVDELSRNPGLSQNPGW